MKNALHVAPLKLEALETTAVHNVAMPRARAVRPTEKARAAMLDDDYDPDFDPAYGDEDSPPPPSVRKRSTSMGRPGAAAKKKRMQPGGYMPYGSSGYDASPASGATNAMFADDGALLGGEHLMPTMGFEEGMSNRQPMMQHAAGAAGPAMEAQGERPRFEPRRQRSRFRGVFLQRCAALRDCSACCKSASTVSVDLLVFRAAKWRPVLGSTALGS